MGRVTRKVAEEHEGFLTKLAKPVGQSNILILLDRIFLPKPNPNTNVLSDN